MKSKNVIIVDENLPYLLNGLNHPVGGASVQTSNWIHGFESNGFIPIIFSSVNLKNESCYNIEPSPKIKGFRRPFLLMKVATMFFKVLVRYRPEFIYLSTPFWSNFIFILPANLLGVKTIQRISNDNLILSRARKKFNKIKYLFYVLSLKKASILLCQNNYQKKHFKLEFPSKQILKLYNPFLFKSNDTAIEREYVAWIGLFQYQKNLPALYKLAKNLPNIEFKIAGKAYENIDGDTHDAINLLRELNNVTFIGLLPRDKISNFLSKAYCLLNTSRYEGFSNTYLEALSVGTPIVTRKKTDPDSIIEKYNLGYVEESYKDLPKAINKLVNEKFDYDYLHKYIINYHNPKSLTDKLINNKN